MCPLLVEGFDPQLDCIDTLIKLLINWLIDFYLNLQLLKNDQHCGYFAFLVGSQMCGKTFNCTDFQFVFRLLQGSK